MGEEVGVKVGREPGGGVRGLIGRLVGFGGGRGRV